MFIKDINIDFCKLKFFILLMKRMKIITDADNVDKLIILIIIFEGINKVIIQIIKRRIAHESVILASSLRYSLISISANFGLNLPFLLISFIYVSKFLYFGLMFSLKSFMISKCNITLGF